MDEDTDGKIMFHVKYEDADEEDMYYGELRRCLPPPEYVDVNMREHARADGFRKCGKRRSNRVRRPPAKQKRRRSILTKMKANNLVQNLLAQLRAGATDHLNADVAAAVSELEEKLTPLTRSLAEQLVFEEAQGAERARQIENLKKDNNLLQLRLQDAFRFNHGGDANGNRGKTKKVKY